MINLEKINADLRHKSPESVVKWALNRAQNPVITTNFRPYESALLHLVTRQAPSIKVIWCDTGYNTPETYQHAQTLIHQLDLNIQLFTPKQTAAYRNTTLGIPEVGTPEHQLFSEQVKLEPFRRALKTHQPDVWFTNLRKGQTTFRNHLDRISKSKDGVLKISPFYNYTDEDLEGYLKAYQLPNEKQYYDPTKALPNRECGIHL